MNAPGRVDIWHFRHASAPLAAIEAFARTLSDDERVAAYRFGDEALRRRYIVNHAMARAILGRYALGPDTDIVLAAGSHGKPYVAAPDAARHVRFNMAHSSSMCVVAIAAHREVGIDVERIRPDIAIDEIAHLYFTERELAALARVSDENRANAFFACWTRKEALLKAQGTGLLREPRTVHVGLGPYARRDIDGSDSCLDGWTVTALDFPPGYAGAIAVEGTKIGLRLRQWHMPKSVLPRPAQSPLNRETSGDDARIDARHDFAKHHERDVTEGDRGQDIGRGEV